MSARASYREVRDRVLDSRSQVLQENIEVEEMIGQGKRLAWVVNLFKVSCKFWRISNDDFKNSYDK